MGGNLLVIGDSLTYHGPDRPHLLDDPRLWPNVAAAQLGSGAKVDLVARLGWTARDAWWAVTKDPRLWGRVLPRADALILAVGGMDHLPAAIPTYLRDGIPYVSPAPLRREVRKAYRALSPVAIRATRGLLRQLPQGATDQYLTRMVQAVRHFNPDAPVVLLAPPPHRSAAYPSHRHHEPAVAAAHRWAAANDAVAIDLDEHVLPSLLDGTANPDGLHWSWRTHGLVGRQVATALAGTWPRPPAIVTLPGAGAGAGAAANRVSILGR